MTHHGLFLLSSSQLLDGLSRNRQNPVKYKRVRIPCFYFGTGVYLSSVVMPMYQVKAVIPGEIKIDLPTCMYKLPNIHAQGTSCGEHAFQVITLLISSKD